jgi:hypothetical protein
LDCAIAQTGSAKMTAAKTLYKVPENNMFPPVGIAAALTGGVDGDAW